MGAEAAAPAEVVVVVERAVVEAADAEAASNRPNRLSQGLRLPARKLRKLAGVAAVVAVVSGAADAAPEFLRASTP